MTDKDAWLKDVEKSVKRFAKNHFINYHKTKRELSASFEIGCFHALLNYYEGMSYTLTPENLVDKKYRYLTTPNGSPTNFSYIHMSGPDGNFDIRQQVRIYSHIDKDIAFAPDLVVLMDDAAIDAVKDKDYASGKRPFYTVSSKSVVAAHECKSMVPFPELLVSFIGMFITAHEWYQSDTGQVISQDKKGVHLAPTLFVGGTARALHLRMIAALERAYPINVVVGLHQGTWNLYSNNRKLNKLKCVLKGSGSSQHLAKKVSDADIPF